MFKADFNGFVCFKNYYLISNVFGGRCIVGYLCNHYKILLLRVSFGLTKYILSLLFSLRRAFPQWLSFAIFERICYQIYQYNYINITSCACVRQILYNI